VCIAIGINRRWGHFAKERLTVTFERLLYTATAHAYHPRHDSRGANRRHEPRILPELPPKPSEDVTSKLFPGFVQTEDRTTGATVPVCHKGDGPPVLLLHGYPETHVTWHKVAPRLGSRFSVYVPDLRGYGDSSRPSDGDRHINYSFRAMALDQVETMRHFGHEPFLVGAHDRGARVAHRLCLDFPTSVTKVCLMDIAPTLTMYRHTNQEFSTKYMWWFFLIQGAPLPEHLIGLDPQYYLEATLDGLNKTPGAITREALSEYRRCFCCTSTIHGGCEDFRASAGIGLEMDEADDHAGHKIVAPVHALWGAKTPLGSCGTSSRPGGRKRAHLLPGAVSIAAISSRKNGPRKPFRNWTTSSPQCRFRSNRRLTCKSGV